ncbi:MAG TPA: hypothetical protein VMD09_01925 [Solirubrobacteraceae bacterium]|nr:hypothetical protein [Solirubrobacteraceae bacterium]
MASLEDIAALLDDAEDQLRTAQTLHDQAFKKSIARSQFKARVKNILEAQRSALDYLAVEITNQRGTPKGLIYYPLAQSASEFDGEMNGKMPGVMANAPDIAKAVEARQPFQPGYDWLRDLNQLTREQKHNRLSTQLIREIQQCRVTHKPTGAVIGWQGLTFEPGKLIADVGGMFTVGSRPPEMQGHAMMNFQTPNPYGTPLVFGVPIDPQTQEPLPSPDLDVQRGPIHLWAFASPHLPVMNSLGMFQRQVRILVSDIAQAAGL